MSAIAYCDTFIFERIFGFEPKLQTWKAHVLAVKHHIRILVELNHLLVFDLLYLVGVHFYGPTSQPTGPTVRLASSVDSHCPSTSSNDC